jgi:hypothetical protein
MKRMPIRSAIFISILLLSGCAHTVKMDYKPLGAQQQSKNISVLLEDIKDVRPLNEREVLGKVKNAFGMDAGTVREPKDLLPQIKTSIEKELLNAGYTVTADTQLKITSELVFLSCYFKDEGHALIRMKFIVTDRGQEVINHTYSGEGSHRTDWEWVPFTGAIQKATGTMLQEFVKDLNGYVIS